MSFQVSSADGTEIKESVATAEEEFKNSTAEETERKLEDQEEFKNSTAEKLKRKLIHEDEEDFKNSTVEESERKVIPEDQEEFKDIRTKKLKRKLAPEDEEDLKNSTAEESETKIVPEDEDEEEEQSSGDFRLLYNRLPIAPIPINGRTDLKRLIDPESLSGRLFPKKKKRKAFHLEDKDDEKDKEIPRTQSMDNLLLMQKPQHQ